MPNLLHGKRKILKQREHYGNVLQHRSGLPLVSLFGFAGSFPCLYVLISIEVPTPPSIVFINLN